MLLLSTHHHSKAHIYHNQASIKIQMRAIRTMARSLQIYIMCVHFGLDSYNSFKGSLLDVKLVELELLSAETAESFFMRKVTSLVGFQ